MVLGRILPKSDGSLPGTPRKVLFSREPGRESGRDLGWLADCFDQASADCLLGFLSFAEPVRLILFF